MNADRRLHYIYQNIISKIKKTENILIISNSFSPDYIKSVNPGFFLKSSFKDTFDYANKIGLKTELKKPLKFKYIIISQSLSKNETLSNVLFAIKKLSPEGNIVIEGHNKTGIKNTLNYFKKINSIDKIISKYHGKIFLLDNKKLSKELLSDLKKIKKPLKIKNKYFTIPGVFSEKGIDKASEYFTKIFDSNLNGYIADIGSGWGYLSAEALKKSKNIKKIYLFELNKNAIDISKVNINDSRAVFKWVDILKDDDVLFDFDYVICNPPFHKNKKIDFDLGKNFIKRGSEMLNRNGIFLMVANINLPYEKTLEKYFQNIKLLMSNNKFKIIEARIPLKVKKIKFGKNYEH